MYTTVAVLPTEDRLEYLNFSKGIFYSLFPVCAEEESLTLEMINTSWRLRRCADMEVSIHEQNLPIDETLKQLNRLSLHEARMTRNREMTRKMLRDAQKERQRNQVSDEANMLLDGKDFRLDMQLRMMGFKYDESALMLSITEQINIEHKEHNDKVLARRAQRAAVDVELKQRLADHHNGFVPTPPETTPTATENPPQ
jgi:hypothetical protein